MTKRLLTLLTLLGVLSTTGCIWRHHHDGYGGGGQRGGYVSGGGGYSGH